MDTGVAVSVLTPSYGYGRFIADALASVPSQGSGISCEHIVHDALSRDETGRHLEQFSRGRAVRWRSEPDMGQSDALNKALALSTGRWIAWLNADEFYLPGALEILVRSGEASGADVIYGDAVFANEEGSLLRLVPQHRFSGSVLRWYGTFISSCAAIFRRDVIGATPWDPDLRLLMDWDLYLKLMQAGATFAHIPRPIGVFRVHAGGVSARPHERRHFHEYRIVRERYGIRGGLRLPGRSLHSAYKLRDGSYARQFAARAHKGVDLRWFRPDVGDRGWLDLVGSAYPETTPDRLSTER